MRTLVNRIATPRASAWLRMAGQLVYPPTCLLCGAPGESNLDLCCACQCDLPRNTHPCPRCALPMDRSAPPESECGRCQRNPPPFRKTICPFLYRPPLGDLISTLKFRSGLPEGRLLGMLLTSAVGGSALPDAIVPMPLHRKRLRERGFNQALEIARQVGGSLHRPVIVDALRRVRATTTQTGSDAEARRRNVRRAFAPGAACPPPRIALLDDVVTTGATVAEAARTLRQAGVEEITVWAVARTPP